MKSYDLISLEQAASISLEQLVHDYNDAVEMIWHLQQKLLEQMKESDQLWQAYEELADQLHG